MAMMLAGWVAGAVAVSAMELELGNAKAKCDRFSGSRQEFRLTGAVVFDLHQEQEMVHLECARITGRLGENKETKKLEVVHAEAQNVTRLRIDQTDPETKVIRHYDIDCREMVYDRAAKKLTIPGPVKVSGRGEGEETPGLVFEIRQQFEYFFLDERPPEEEPSAESSPAKQLAVPQPPPG